ncbi:MAG: glycosyltransferase family 4 protein [Prevotellaceae bacterium]|nr:glycosyltransferase family 4 protein [Prevotellaceae bacterium]
MKKKLIRLTTVDISLRNLINGQLRFLNQYYDVVGVAADNGQLHDVEQREGIRVIDVPMRREIALLPDLRSLWQLYKLMRRERPYILHCNTPKGSLLGLIAGWMARVPHRVYTVTGLRYQGASGMLRWLLLNMERLSCAFATKVIPEGQGVLHTLQTDHITRKPLQVLHYGNINGIDTAYFSRAAVAKDYPQIDRHGLDLEDDDFVFVFVGRIVKDKGINELARCLKKIDCQIILVGSFDDDDPISPEAAQYLKSAHNVKCVGWQDDMRPYLALADALVFPSYREGFPNVPIQAGALDLPCIVTDINGCNEIIKDGLNGKIIAAPLSVGHEQMENALYQTMKWFVEHPEEVRRMSRNARSMITSRYEQQDIWRATLLMYQNLGK